MSVRMVNELRAVVE
jgi:putative toxin-antitoxin system antitoxin component (TIGR02293 family)